MDYETILKEKWQLEQENRRLRKILEEQYEFLGNLQQELKEIKQSLRTSRGDYKEEE